MIHYNCACLIKIKNKKIFLVRTHDNEKYYLPGGKIEENETLDEACMVHGMDPEYLLEELNK